MHQSAEHNNENWLHKNQMLNPGIVLLSNERDVSPDNRRPRQRNRYIGRALHELA